MDLARTSLRAYSLIGLAAASYVTSFARERYLLQHALGSTALDGAVVAYGLAALLGNLWAIALSLIWIDGRRNIPIVFKNFGLIGALAIFLYPVSSLVGSALLLAALIGAFEFNRQRAAFVGKQALTLIATVVTPIISVAAWIVFGLDSLSKIIVGYTAGYLLQSGVAWAVGRRARPQDLWSERTTHQASGLWPIGFAFVTQLNGISDRWLMVLAGPGWAGAAGFSLSLAAAAMAIVIGPLGSEAVAGRMAVQPTRRLLWISCAMTLLGAATLPTLLPWLVAGGVVDGANYSRVRDLALVYFLSIPGAGYWLFRARALQIGAHMWRPVTMSGVVMFLVHALIAVPAVATGHPLGAAVGWLVSSYVGAALLFRDGLSLPKAPVQM